MRLGITILILVAVIFGSGYWYTAFGIPCNTPIYYRIGDIDSRFETDKAELVRISQRAEKVWEDALLEDLFVYDENAKLPINLVFDDRQREADLEEELREDLDAKEGMSENVAEQYEKLILEFRKLKRDYEARVVAYESRLSAYNRTVSEWNKKGGAPESEMEELREEQEALEGEKRRLEASAAQLNNLVSQLNAIGARGNSLITDYNTIVKEYNEHFAETKEFTQGDYTGESINIYQFNNEEELVTVLAHEFGHALSLGHVENSESIMFHFMNDQKLEEGITPEDTAEYHKICSQEKSGIVTFMQAIRNIF